MSKFKFMVFSDDSFVAHADKYTKEQVLDMFNGNEKPYIYQTMLSKGTCRPATIEDVKENTCKYIAYAPPESDFKSGCYMLGYGGRGSFKVWAINTWSLKLAKSTNEGGPNK